MEVRQETHDIERNGRKMGCVTPQGKLLLCGGPHPRRWKNGYYLVGTKAGGKIAVEGKHIVKVFRLGATTTKILKNI